MSNQYKITEEQKKQLLQISAQTLPDNPSREGYSAEQIRGRLYKPYAALIDMINGVFGTAYTDVSDMQTALQNGDIFSRGFVGWNPTYTYGAGEVTFYPDIGTYGAFVKSVQAGNTNHAPYTDGTVNSAWWSEVVNFNTVTDDFFTEIKAAQTAAEAAQSAAETAQGKAEDAQAAAEEAESGAQTQAQAAASSATAAAGSAGAAESAKAAAQTAQNAAESAEGNAQAYAGQASGSASAASQSEINARAYMEQAKQYAQKEYQVVESFDDLPRPGDSAYIYLVPSGSGSSNDNYSEYLWISEANDYEFVGAINEVDLSGYAQTNGTYPNMTVGNASNAANAEKASQDAAGNDISATYAKQTGTYPNMSVGTASEAGYADAAASADTAGYATTAKGDASGNDIEATYATKEALTEGLAGKQPTGNYALQNGTYPNMTVGNATQAGSANDPNAVHFTAQTLTDEQKAQARTNIGVTQGTDGLDALTYSDICELTSVPSLSQQYSFDRSKFNRSLEFHDIFICPSEYITDGVTRTWLVVFEVIEPLLNSDCRIKAFVETTGAKGEKGDKGDPGEGGGGGGGSLYLHRVCLPLSAITTVEHDIAIFSIYSSSSTPFTIETFFEWLLSHFAAVPESYFDYPSLPAFSCVSNYSGDNAGHNMYPAALTYIVDDSENQGEPAYDIKINGEGGMAEGLIILSQVDEQLFIDTVTEV